jgi:hypothetical protein
MRQGTNGFLLMCSKFYPTRFGKWLPSSAGRRYLYKLPKQCVLWAYMGYDPSSVAGCRGMTTDHTERNPYMPTTQILLG